MFAGVFVDVEDGFDHVVFVVVVDCLAVLVYG